MISSLTKPNSIKVTKFYKIGNSVDLVVQSVCKTKHKDFSKSDHLCVRKVLAQYILFDEAKAGFVFFLWNVSSAILC